MVAYQKKKKKEAAHCSRLLKEFFEWNLSEVFAFQLTSERD